MTDVAQQLIAEAYREKQKEVRVLRKRLSFCYAVILMLIVLLLSSSCSSSSHVSKREYRRTGQVPISQRDSSNGTLYFWGGFVITMVAKNLMFH